VLYLAVHVKISRYMLLARVFPTARVENLVLSSPKRLIGLVAVISSCFLAITGCGNHDQDHFISTWVNNSERIYPVFSTTNNSIKSHKFPTHLTSNEVKEFGNAKKQWDIAPSTARVAIDNDRQRVIVAHSKHTAGLLIHLKKGRWENQTPLVLEEPGVTGLVGRIGNGYYQVTLLVPKTFHKPILITSDRVKHKIPITNSVASITVKETDHPSLQWIGSNAEYVQKL
jgi:hypothetical protein